jgi:hypothetical protein
MQPTLNIMANWETLDRGSPEEKACFAALGIQCNNHWLTEGRDGFVSRTRNEPLLSSYHLAEWLAWNWWRLRWEPRPRSNTEDWRFAHRLTAIGAGYVWPNVTIFSDGERTALIARPTEDRNETAFRYISDFAAVVPSVTFETAVDHFFNQVLGQLQAEGVDETNLSKIWNELIAERYDPAAARHRKLEALLGRSPDEGDPGTIERLSSDAAKLGERAIEELAADQGQRGVLPTADDLIRIAEHSGYGASPKDVVAFSPVPRLPSPRDTPAWVLGAEAARILRAQQGMGEELISSNKLAEMAGVAPVALTDRKSSPVISFALDESHIRSRVALRSRWLTGRRFELARLLADRIVLPTASKLHPATRAYTYRQKMQRSFAAELLSPFEAVDKMLDGDYSSEAQQDAAEQFQVSEVTIRTQLVNHHRVEREQLEELSAAA